MTKISLKMFKSSFKINAFVIFQLGVVFSVCIFMISSVFSRYEYYLPLKDIMNSKASAVSFASSLYDNEQSKAVRLFYNNSDSFGEEFIKPQNSCYTRYSPFFTNDERTLKAISYTKNTYSLYSPNLISGDWNRTLSQKLTSDGCIPAIIFQNQYDYKIGDVISANTKKYSEERVSVNLKVCGIIGGDAMLFGNSNFADGLHNHTSFFESVNDIMQTEVDNDEPCLLVIVSQDLLHELEIMADFTGVYGIIAYDSSTTDEQVIANNSRLATRYGLDAKNIGTIKINSIKYINYQIFALLPIFICVLLLTIISGICTNAVIAKKNMRTYAIFNMCGATKSKCVLMCVLQVLFSSAVSLPISFFLIKSAQSVFGFDCTINIFSIIGCVAIAILNVLLSMILPYNIIGKSSLKEMIKE